MPSSVKLEVIVEVVVKVSRWAVAEAMWWFGCGGYVVGWLRRLCGGWVADSSGNKAISAFN